MNHLEYKDVNNKAFSIYYTKFKKMVKEDLEGDGWFLLVNDFPFKPEKKGEKFNPKLMFTAGENIGKWTDKALVSLYGKTNYILGRCRKKGPVLSLLDFQEGDYIKNVTESGLKKQLKDYFQGTGVSTRIYKSLKVTEATPETDDDRDEGDSTASASVSMPELNSLSDKRNYIMKMGKELPTKAENAGISEDSEFKKHWMNLTRMVRGGKVDPALEIVQKVLVMIENAGGGEKVTEEAVESTISPGIAAALKALGIEPPDTSRMNARLEKLKKELAQLEDQELPTAQKAESEADKSIASLEPKWEAEQKKMDALSKKINKNLDQIAPLNKKGDESSMEKVRELAEENINMIEKEAPAILSKSNQLDTDIKAQYLTLSDSAFRIASLNSRIEQLKKEISQLESELNAVAV